tara:strand:- start:129 stop:698 length:570 start_codon:yes stop_codon:yes gene_type:complete
MGTSYGRQIHKVVSGDIDTVTQQNCTILTNDNSGNHNTYVLKLQFNASGCGGSEAGGNITINNLVEGWRWEYITWKNELYGYGSCYNFNENGYGGQGVNGLVSYSTSTSVIDSVQWCYQSFEVAGISEVMKRCDNAASNMFRMAPDPKVFWTTRRRDSSTSPAGPSHGRSCNSTGAGATWRVSDIVVFR